MKIYVNVKSIRKSNNYMSQKQFILPDENITLRSLLTLLTYEMIAEYRADGNSPYTAITGSQLEELKSSGRVRFGKLAKTGHIDEKSAVDNMIQCFTDGFFRVFCNLAELTELDGMCNLKENDCITIVKFVPLAGIR